jgi:PAS domain S-box-containing protein
VSSYEVVFGDFFLCPMCGEIHLDVAAPLVDDENQPMAVLILRINPETFLYPLVQSWPLPSNSAETLLVRREGNDVLFLNRLRLQPDQALSIRIPVSETNLPAVRAVLGETGQFEGKDYTGREVLSDIRHVPDSPWFIISKASTYEIFADLYHREILILLLTLILVLLTGAGIGFIYKHKGKRAFESLYQIEREKNEAQEKIRIINQAQSKLLKTEDIVEIYRLVAEQIRELLGIGIAITSILDEATQTLRMVAYYGLNLPISRIIKLLGMDPTKTAYSLEDMTEDELQLFRSGGLEQLPGGIYALATRKIPVKLCNMVEKLLGVDGVYTMGFVWEGKHLGGLTILAKGDISPKKDAIELIMNNASITINRIRSQVRLMASETRYRRLFESAKDGILILDALSGQVIDVNPFLLDLLGFSYTDIIGKELWEISLFQDISRSKESFLELQDKEYIRYEDLQLETHDGRIIDVEFISNVYLVNDKKVIQCSIRDITKRKRSEKARHESEEKYRNILENIDDGYFEVDIAGNLIFFNSSTCKILGYSEEELMGMNNREYMDEENAKKVYQTFNIIYQTGISTKMLDWKLIRKDGSECFVETIVSLLKDSDDRQIGFRGVARDISDRRRLESQLYQAQKMESIGNLAGGVAHDYNNALSVIIGFTEMAIDEVESDGPVHADLEEVLSAAKRATDITRQLLAFARKQAIAPKVLDLNESVGSMLKMLRRLIGEDINLAWLPGASLWSVKMDPTQIDQILANLCVNARDAIENVGKISIETSKVVLSPYH